MTDATHTLDQPAVIPPFLVAVPGEPRPEASPALLAVLKLTDEEAAKVWYKASQRIADFPRFDDPQYATPATSILSGDEILHKPRAKALLLAAIKSSTDQADLILSLVRDPGNDHIVETLMGKPITRPQPKTPAQRLQAVREARGQTPGKNLKFDPSHTVRILVSQNPKRVGSDPHRRFDLYLPGAPVQESLDRGVTAADVRWDIAHNFIELVQP